jgi:spore germination protein KA
MIIIIGITFITGLVFSSGEVISGLRLYRLFLLICSIIFGLYGFVLGGILLILHLASIDSFGFSYLYPLAPLDKTYLFKTLLKNNKDKFRSKELTNNIRKEK